MPIRAIFDPCVDLLTARALSLAQKFPETFLGYFSLVCVRIFHTAATFRFKVRWPMSSKTIPQLSSFPEKISLTMKGAHTSPAVPAGFILAQATPAELDYYGFPQQNPSAKGRHSPVQALIERKWTPKNRII